ncbi:MAG: ArgR family transcriptional regulator [Deltaproteobacteria bacterium]|nr:ArgR family transcriptional regulator [Deltaproteobacteria bacterium]
MHEGDLEVLILDIIQHSEIYEQSDLQEALAKRGHEIPQATLSRRLKKLGIAKVGGVYKVTSFVPSHLPIVLNVQVSDFGSVILQTQPGQATALGYFLDQKYVSYSPKDTKRSGILGTIAGDDTLLLIVRNKPDVKKVLTILYQEFPYLNQGHVI